MDMTDEESLSDLLTQIDITIQYGEDLEPKEPRVSEINFELYFTR